MRNDSGFRLRSNGRFVSPQVTFGSADSASYATPPSYYGHVPGISMTDNMRSMDAWPTVHRSSPGFSVSQNKSESLNAHELYHIARGVSSMSPLIDAALSPAIYKSSGDYSNAKPSDVVTVSREVYVVDDIKEVAKIYEGNGYAVSETYYGNPLHIHNRMYYDVVQCDDMLFGDINSEQVIEDIKSRFANGLRLWHQSESDATLLVCEENSIKLGQLFLKDNVEV